ncbi:MAG TPA: hypothetical protein VFH89_02110 [Sphingomicrobium sp.]|nr:hypothetical protein [Sphingomicrobium sp.]
MAALCDLILNNEPLLDQLFGAGRFKIKEVNDLCCEIVTDAAQIHVAYDLYRMTTDSQLRPLQVPEDLSESMPVEWWLRYLDRDDPLRRRGPLTAEQVTAELHLVGDIIQSALATLHAARDAACFLKGYEHGRLDAD